MKKLLLGLGTIAAVTAPVVSVVACSSGYSAKYVSNEDEANDLCAKILDDAISSADYSGNTILSKDFGGHPGFTINLRLTNVIGGSLSSKISMYDYICDKVWGKLKNNFLNPFQVSFSAPNLMMSKEYFGYAHGCEAMWTNSPTHDDGRLYIR